MENKVIIIDWSDSKSIKSAEKRKSRYENEGYRLISTQQVGFNKFRLEYTKGSRTW